MLRSQFTRWFFATLLLASPLHAESVPAVTPPEDEARSAFLLGVELSHQERWSAARDAFARSIALRPHPITNFNLGFCERALGHWARARHNFALALASEESKLPSDLAANAQDYLAEADSALGTVSVQRIPDAAALAIDGLSLVPIATDAGSRYLAGASDQQGRTALKPGSIIVLIDPGSHLLSAREGTREFEYRIVVESGRPATFAFPLPSLPNGSGEPTAPAQNLQRAPERSSAAFKTVGIAVGVAGVAALSVAGALAIRSSNLNTKSNGHCDASGCDDTGFEQRSDAISSARWATGLSIAGAVAVVSGVALFLWGQKQAATHSQGALSSPLSFSF
jgi:hypothetical protein